VDAVGDRTHYAWPSPDCTYRPGADPLGTVGEAFASAYADCSASSRPVERLDDSGSIDGDKPTSDSTDSDSTDSSSTDRSSTDRGSTDAGGKLFCDDDGTRPDDATFTSDQKDPR